jgi:topoisomerase IV subunit B
MHPASRDNLMITYVFRFFEQLVHDGHVYVLDTPLFRVRNKEKTIYCYSEAERDNAVKELGGKPACVAEADAETEATGSSESKAQSSVQPTSARRRPEITRFKGLGEISPKEFAQFIDKEMRLSKGEYAPKHDASGILTFYMGKNTPERKDYIMDNLVVAVEE